uniref:Uncharacterized protein n=1 Tax=Leersia perrieri TaxID=77586 RepID=A0A0D9WAB3_9ORYZ
MAIVDDLSALRQSSIAMQNTITDIKDGLDKVTELVWALRAAFEAKETASPSPASSPQPAPAPRSGSLDSTVGLPPTTQQPLAAAPISQPSPVSKAVVVLSCLTTVQPAFAVSPSSHPPPRNAVARRCHVLFRPTHQIFKRRASRTTPGTRRQPDPCRQDPLPGGSYPRAWPWQRRRLFCTHRKRRWRLPRAASRSRRLPRAPSRSRPGDASWRPRAVLRFMAALFSRAYGVRRLGLGTSCAAWLPDARLRQEARRRFSHATGAELHSLEPGFPHGDAGPHGPQYGGLRGEEELQHRSFRAAGARLGFLLAALAGARLPCNMRAGWVHGISASLVRLVCSNAYAVDATICFTATGAAHAAPWAVLGVKMCWPSRCRTIPHQSQQGWLLGPAAQLAVNPLRCYWVSRLLRGCRALLSLKGLGWGPPRHHDSRATSKSRVLLDLFSFQNNLTSRDVKGLLLEDEFRHQFKRRLLRTRPDCSSRASCI